VLFDLQYGQLFFFLDPSFDATLAENLVLALAALKLGFYTYEPQCNKFHSL